MTKTRKYKEKKDLPKQKLVKEIETVIRNSNVSKIPENDLPIKDNFRIWEPGYKLKPGELINFHRIYGKVVVKWPVRR